MYPISMDPVLPFSAVNGDSDPLDPVYLPAELEVLDMPNYFRLQRTDRYLPGNVSLGSRSETYLLLHHQPTAQPVIQATYLPFTARQVTLPVQPQRGVSTLHPAHELGDVIMPCTAP